MDKVFQEALKTHCASNNARGGQPVNEADNDTDRQHLAVAGSENPDGLANSRNKTSSSLSSSKSSVVYEVPRIPKLVSLANIEKDALEILKVVRPQWIHEQMNMNSKGIPILSKPLPGGITNRLFIFYRATDPDPKDTVVIKLYGKSTERMIDRAAEIETLELLSEYECSPQLYAVFENGICYEFIHGETLDPDKCRLPQVYALVAAEVARLHSIPLEEAEGSLEDEKSIFRNVGDGGGVISSCMWGTMRQFTNLLEKVFVEKPALRQKLAKDSNFTLERAKVHIDQLERILEAQGMPVAFCHNDLLPGNLIYNESEKKVKMIDFEYAMPNYTPYDVANHFNEFAGLDMPDYSKLPDAKFKQNWIKEYLKSYEGADKLTQSDFEKWVDMSAPASHLLWTLWAAIQAGHSELDFDYARYAEIRYGEFERSRRTMRMRYGL